MFTCRVHLQSQRKLRTYSPGSRSEGTYRRWYLQCSTTFLAKKYYPRSRYAGNWPTKKQLMQRPNDQWQRSPSRAIKYLNIVNDIAPSSPIAAAFLIWRQERISRPPVRNIKVKIKNKNNLRTNWPRNVCELMLDSNLWSQGFMG